jgi:hypothetical protein
MLTKTSLILAMLAVCALFAAGSPNGEGGFTEIFNGKDLSGWHVMGHQDWHAENGIFWTEGKGGWLRSDKTYADFVWRLEYRATKDSNSGIFLRAAEAGNPAFTGMEIQILDDAGKPADVHSSGSIYGASAPQLNAARPAGRWNRVEISCVGRHVTIILNGTKIQDVNLNDPRFEHAQERPLSRVPEAGYIGLQSHSNRVEFRNLRIKVLKPAA